MNKGCLRNVLIGAGVLFGLCMIVGIIGAIANPQSSTTPPMDAATSTSEQAAVSTSPSATSATAKPTTVASTPTPLPPTSTPKPPTATPVPPTPTPKPDKSQAKYVDPRELGADAKAFVGQSIVLTGIAQNVEHHDSAGLFDNRPFTWISMLAEVRGRNTTESIVIHVFPKEPKILKQDCYRIYGVVKGTETVRIILTGANREVPVVEAYEWEHLGAPELLRCTED